LAGQTKETVAVRLPSQAIKMMDELISVGLYGDTRGEVARNLILDQLKRIAAEQIIQIKTDTCG
jgi:Arc/MetJ-type ribon-helix-helix transcriptional regulator